MNASRAALTCLLTIALASPATAAVATAASATAVPAAGTAARPASLLLDGSGSAASCSKSGYDEITVPGWAITRGDPNVVCYANDGGFPGSSTPGAQPGPGYFTGGQRGDGQLTQTVAVSADAAAIDAGTARYDLSGWLGGFGAQDDRAEVVATFLGAGGTVTGSAAIGPVTAADRGFVSEFLHRSATGAIPAGTRSIRVEVNFTWTAGQTTDGYASHLSLSVSPPLAPPRLTVPRSTVPRFDHVFLVYMENENYSAASNPADGGAGIIGNPQAPYINGLAEANTLLTDYHASTHYSDPNYLSVAGGSTFGHTAGNGNVSNCIATCTFASPSLADRVIAAGETWKQYAQSAHGACDYSQHGYYYPDDVPFGYFKDMKDNPAYCRAHWQPLSSMFTDLKSAATTPDFVWFDANDCADMESCGIKAGDAWLSRTLPRLFRSPAWTTQRSLLIITWDEDGNNLPGGFGPGQSNQVATILAGSQHAVKAGYRSAIRYDHYSVARTIEQALGLRPMTSNDKYADPVNDAFR